MAAQWIRMPPGLWHFVTSSAERPSTPDPRLNYTCACGRKGPAEGPVQETPNPGDPVCPICKTQGGS